MKRFAFFVIALAILGISTGCGGNKPQDADFYTFAALPNTAAAISGWG